VDKVSILLFASSTDTPNVFKSFFKKKVNSSGGLNERQSVKSFESLPFRTSIGWVMNYYVETDFCA
jgi:hypothetical protein